MENISLDYIMILKLKLESYMEKEIKDIRKDYNEYSSMYRETCTYNKDKKEKGRSFSTDYGITKEDYEDYTKYLQIKQYETFLELTRLLAICKVQNDGKDYIGYTNYLLYELIRFKPSYDNVKDMLERLKAE